MYFALSSLLRMQESCSTALPLYSINWSSSLSTTLDLTPAAKMSGIEVAGLVLGAIPLILAGLEFYVKGIAVTRRYRRHEEEFTSLLIELKTENTTYINSINILLFGVVPPMDMANFLANPCGDRWKDSKFDQKLRARLNSSYDSYINTITQMNNTAVMIQQKLMLDSSGKVCQASNTLKWDADIIRSQSMSN